MKNIRDQRGVGVYERKIKRPGLSPAFDLNPGDPDTEHRGSHKALATLETGLARDQNEKAPDESGAFFILIPATTDSPMRLPAQYHRPWRA